MSLFRFILTTATVVCVSWSLGDVASAEESTTLPPISKRFADAEAAETPDFRRHVVPLFGKLGCNGRACHGSFQGQGGFRLSLFGYDFKMDHENLTSGEEPRANITDPLESLMLRKPTLTEAHEGGRRMKVDSWHYRVLASWITGGAKPIAENDAELVRVEVSPSEMIFTKAGEKERVKAIAVWSDGTRENVTPLCRFQSNDDQIVEINRSGHVTSGSPGDTHIVVFYDKAVVPVPVLQPITKLAGDAYPSVDTPTQVDQIVVQKLRKLGIVQSELCTDAEFLRRASLDITGSLPTATEVADFLKDNSPEKRAAKIDELLERPTYVAWWTTQLNDMTGNSVDDLNNVTPTYGKASEDWYKWIALRVAENRPYDEIIAGIVLSTGREEGQSFLEYSQAMSEIYHPKGDKEFADRQTMPHYWARRSIRAPADKALSFAYNFLGVRIQCAQCHKHPFDRWTQDDYNQFTNFFGRIGFGQNPQSRKEYKQLLVDLEVSELKGGELRRELAKVLRKGETVPFSEVFVTKPRKPRNPKNAKANKKRKKKKEEDATPNPRNATTAKLLGGDVVDISQYDDPRVALMDWMRDRNNPFFAKSFVNRVWAAYFHRGIVHPTDDHSLANPPSNSALLGYLSQGFIDSGFDMKWLHREIANSRTYQLSWKPNETNGSDERNFSRAIPRRMPAEVAYDAIQQATASDNTALAMQSDLSGRSIAVPSLSQRRRRKAEDYALFIFGKSLRETNCDCDRSDESSLLQTVYLRNDQQLLSMIDETETGWVADVTHRVVEKKKRQKRNVKTKSGELKQIKRLEDRLEKAKKSDDPKKVKAIQQRLKKMRAAAKKKGVDLDEAASKPNKKVKFEEVTVTVREPLPKSQIDIDQLVEQAYLRTLSRYPDSVELERARQYVSEGDSPVTGARDLLWALVNTKEFIVNH